MKTRNGLIALFAALVAVPVAAAVYLGTAGLARERENLVREEREAMERRADEVRDMLVRRLQDLYRAELERSYVEYQPSRGQVYVVTPLSRNDPFAPIRDWFQVDGDGALSLPWGAADEAPPDILEFAGTAGAQRGAAQQGAVVQWQVEEARPGNVQRKDEAPRAAGSGFAFHGELAVRRVTLPGGARLLQGFRVDPARIAGRYLDPLSPQSVVPRFDDRIERTELVPDDTRRSEPGPGPLGLPQVLYRQVAPMGRDADPILFPRGHAVAVWLRPSSSLLVSLDEADSRLVWTLSAMAAVVALGLLFVGRAVRAESRLMERKAEFVSAVSHELRTPLTSIRMYADMLREGWVKDDAQAKDYFALIASESERLARLVNNVLDFSRIERGKKSFEMRIGDPAPVVREAAEALRPYLREKGFVLAVELPPALPACTFDKDALTQMLVNLIDNAVKYGAQGERKEVRVEAAAKDGEIAVSVLDRGPGVPPGERERIFEPFHRGSNSGGAGGSGLGLALVRHYVAAHGGRVTVGDRAGGGAAFTITLRAA